MKKILEVKNVSLKYHEAETETNAIKDISFSVSQGEFISIVGPSGCGKSTLLSIIAGLLNPSTGEICCDKASVGYMLQKDHLFEWRNILQNVVLGLEVKKKLTDENIAYAKNLLERYGLGDFMNYKPRQLSGGMRQRAALIRTLAIKPEILLLDEPFSSLDYQTRLHVTDEIARIIRNEGKTAILVTHDISEAVSVSDRVVVLTKRPAIVSSIHEISFGEKGISPLKAREESEFRNYFNAIWKEMVEDANP